MFSDLPHFFKEHKLQSDVRTLLLMRNAMDKNLITNLGDLFNTLKSIVVKGPEFLGPYTIAFYNYFLEIKMSPGDRIQDAVLRSETFKNWREKNRKHFDSDLSSVQLADLFLDEIHLTKYDIQKVLNGKELWDKDTPDLEDQVLNIDDDNRRELNKMADYSDLSMDELMERMRKVLQKQQTKHSGGSHWVGTGGISPYGHGGAAKNGVRVGGSGGGKMARAVLNDRNYYPVDENQMLNDNNVDAALATLKGIEEETFNEVLDIPDTITSGLKQGGLFLPKIKNESQKKNRILLFIDNGGYSMYPYVKSVQQLFKKMKIRFSHDLEIFYFHNTIYDKVYSDAQRLKAVSIETILKKSKEYHVFVIGDAAMAPYELNATSVANYKKITTHFKKNIWLNPEPKEYWKGTLTIQVLKELVPMFSLSPKGIEEAIKHLNKKK